MPLEIHDCACEVIHDEDVAAVRAALPPATDFAALAELFKMYADPTRLIILRALEERTLCVCDLAALLGVTKSAVSHQLKSLRLMNLVKYDRQGKIVFYSLADGHVRDIFKKGFEHIHE